MYVCMYVFMYHLLIIENAVDVLNNTTVLAQKLYQSSDRRLSFKVVPTFADRWISTAVFSVS
jgi:hypothetical protein